MKPFTEQPKHLKFPPEMLHAIEKQIKNLLAVLEVNYKADKNFSVYTGTSG